LASRASSAEAAEHLHESPASMTVPLVALAVLAAVAGFAVHAFDGFLQPVFAGLPHGAHAAEGLSEAALIGLSIVAAAVGIGLAWLVYMRGVISAEAVAGRMGRLYGWVQNGYNVNELYWAVFVRPIGRLAQWLATVFDAGVIDGVVNGVALLLRGTARCLRGWQSGYVRRYALSVVYWCGDRHDRGPRDDACGLARREGATWHDNAWCPRS
jgi:NADH-quinone oxidoreductase subunit L